MIRHSDAFLFERPTPNPKQASDERSEYDRDYARIIHSAAFRRLQSKTQVLGLGESDFYRTRLTHSMEVAQIGCGIVRHLDSRTEDPELRDWLPPSPLMNSICLAHDLGHPPFGHGGEIALNYCMTGSGGFEGNGQTLRILSSLETYTENRGMNLTRRTTLGILKYPAPYHRLKRMKLPDASQSDGPSWMFDASAYKPPKCYLDGEEGLVQGWLLSGELARDAEQFAGHTAPTEGRHGKTRHKALDTSIMELADDISYAVHDLEDAISMDLIRRRDFEHHINADACAEFCTQSSLTYADLKDGLFSDQAFMRKQLIGKLVHYFINAISLKQADEEFASPLFRLQARMDEQAAPLLDGLKQLVLKRVIRSSSVQQLEFKGQKLVVELFEVLAHDPERLLPDAVFEEYQKQDQSLRVICDYVSAMSDNHAVRLYQKIFTPREGSIFDRY